MYRSFLFTAAFLLSLLASSLREADTIKVEVEPRVCLAPCSLTIKVQVRTHPADSAVIVIADGPNYFTYDQYNLDDDTRFIPDRTYYDLPGGDYNISAQLVAGTDPAHQKWIAGDSMNVKIVGDEPTPEPTP